MGKNKQATCIICLRIMRSDNLKRHMKNKHEKKNEYYPTRKRKLEDEEYQPMIKKKLNVLDDEELERDMINDNEEYCVISVWIRITGICLPFVNKIGFHLTLHIFIILINNRFIGFFHPIHF